VCLPLVSDTAWKAPPCSGRRVLPRPMSIPWCREQQIRTRRLPVSPARAEQGQGAVALLCLRNARKCHPLAAAAKCCEGVAFPDIPPRANAVQGHPPAHRLNGEPMGGTVCQAASKWVACPHQPCGCAARPNLSPGTPPLRPPALQPAHAVPASRGGPRLGILAQSMSTARCKGVGGAWEAGTAPRPTCLGRRAAAHLSRDCRPCAVANACSLGPIGPDLATLAIEGRMHQFLHLHNVARLFNV
jgi:hypothetical protein